MKAELAHVPLIQISVSSTNKMFRDQSEFQVAQLQELIDSVKEKGVIQPVLLRPDADGFELVCGERRLHASKAAGLDTIPAYIRELSDDEALELQITENLQRNDINPIKEAKSFQWIIKNKKLSAKALADKIGKSADYVEERIRLNQLCDRGQELVANGVLPLKAGLKLARVPAELQDKAIKYCTDEIEGANGKHTVFEGLSRLQSWLDQNVFNTLAHADFDINDSELRPSAGSCIGCIKRTKNSGGLFDDVAKNDMCLDSACFKQKQLAQYALLKSELQVKFPGAEIVYKARSYEAENSQTFKKLQPRLEYWKDPNTITEAQMHAELEKLDKLQKCEAQVAILIGVDEHDVKANKKKYLLISTKKEVAKKSGLKSLLSKTKEDATVQIQKQQSRLEKDYVAREICKKSSPKVREDLIRFTVVQLLDMADDDELLTGFKHIGIDCTMWKGKEELAFKAATANLADFEGYIIDDREKVISKLSAAKLIQLLGWAIYLEGYGTRDELLKKLKVDVKALSSKAKTDATKWWKQKQAEQKKVKAPKPKGGKQKTKKK